MVHAISSAAEFDALIGSKKPVLVKFCAAWCGSCRRFVPAFDALATQYPGVEFVTVDVDGVQEVFNAQFAGCSRVSATKAMEHPFFHLDITPEYNQDSLLLYPKRHI